MHAAHSRVVAAYRYLFISTGNSGGYVNAWHCHPYDHNMFTVVAGECVVELAPPAAFDKAKETVDTDSDVFPAPDSEPTESRARHCRAGDSVFIPRSPYPYP